MDDYSGYPRTINELKSDRTHAAKDWTPRDLLISALRDIDSGQLGIDKASRCILLIGHVDETGSTQVEIRRAGTASAWESMGILAEATTIIAGNR
jgi:hypothetical protein